MTTDTKRHIDAARQVLVGVVPNPTSQIDQITNALIYKFMDDMDQSAIKQGGDPSFFIGDLEKYSWTRLMDARIGNQERMNIYSEALIKFSESKQLPQLFREIFKSAFLPYRSPEVLGLFLKEIDYFDYSHPEELGNAYEYLLSIMSSQGDAGQFRTPRHIIDFMVDVVDPTMEDKVLDPACGTGGFLVSAYKHILKQHDGKDDLKKKERPLTPDQRKNLMGNFEGYDVDPGMVRIAQVNMYLHSFKNPKIYPYDTLTMEERWSDKFSVILANPPFMSPKGGVSTHKKFSIQSNRSEVLFVDYIMNHLRPQGRAGIIVPEGIIFQSGTAHKQLRKSLVEDGLYAVVSLPSGVFNPYAGVKTSILFFDNELAKKSDDILFIKILNDGFDLGAQRRPHERNDLPHALKTLQAQNTAIQTGNENSLLQENSLFAWVVKKEKIAESGEYNLSGDRYRVATDYTNAKWPMVELGEVLDYEQPTNYIVESVDYNDSYPTPVLTAGKSFILGYTNEQKGIFYDELPVIIFDDFTTATKFVDFPFKVKSSAMKILRAKKDKVNIRYAFYAMQRVVFTPGEHKRYWISQYSKFKIPLPPLEVQEQIVTELNGYKNIITGAKQIIANWKPVIDIDPEWKKVKLGEILDRISEQVDPRKSTGEVFYVGLEKIESNSGRLIGEPSTKYGEIRSLKNVFKQGDLLYGKLRPNLNKVWLANRDGICSTDILVFRAKDSVDTNFYWYLFLSEAFVNGVMAGIKGAQLPRVGFEHLRNTILPLPSIEIQKQIVKRIESERTLVEGSKKLIEMYEQKTRDTLAKLWEE